MNDSEKVQKAKHPYDGWFENIPTDKRGELIIYIGEYKASLQIQN